MRKADYADHKDMVHHTENDGETKDKEIQEMQRSPSTLNQQNTHAMQDLNKYDAIIDLPHRQSLTRPHMSMDERAAQFAPFATLHGYDAAIREAEEAEESDET